MKSRKRTMFVAAAAVLCLVLLAAIAGCAPEDKNVLKIGNVGPLTGEMANYGINVKQGVEIAVEEANNSGELGDIILEFISEDTGGEPAAAANAFQKLIDRDQVDVIVGAVLSGETAAGGPIVLDEKIPTISPSSTAKDLTLDNPYLFRNCLTDEAQIEQMAQYAIEELGLSRFAILWVNNDYGVSLKKSFEDGVKKGNAEVIVTESFKDKEENFKGELTTIKSKNPDCLYIAGYYTEAAKAAQQAREQGLDVQILGADGLCNIAYIDIGGEAVEGTCATSGFYPDDPTPAVQNFVQTYKDKYGEEPDMFAAQAYDAARIVIEAIKSQGVTLENIKDGTASELIREGIAATRDFPGITGKTSLDEEGDTIKDVLILKVENGKFVRVR